MQQDGSQFGRVGGVVATRTRPALNMADQRPAIEASFRPPHETR